MKNILLLSLVFLLVCFGLVATASADGVDVELACPTAVKAGTALYVTVYPYNWDCSGSVTVSRAMMVLGGNSGGTLGSAGIWGPYNTTFSAWTIPVSPCNGSPGAGTPRAMKIISSVPSTLANTVAMVMVMFLSSSGETLGGGDCMVNVVP